MKQILPVTTVTALVSNATGAVVPNVSLKVYNLETNSRPDRLAKGTLPSPMIDRWFDRNAFPVVPLGAFSGVKDNRAMQLGLRLEF